jgi:hypothetical protein
MLLMWYKTNSTVQKYFKWWVSMRSWNANLLLLVLRVVALTLVRSINTHMKVSKSSAAISIPLMHRITVRTIEESYLSQLLLHLHNCYNTVWSTPVSNGVSSGVHDWNSNDNSTSHTGRFTITSWNQYTVRLIPLTSWRIVTWLSDYRQVLEW